MSNSHFTTFVSTTTLIRCLKWRLQIGLCVCLCRSFHEGPCHSFSDRIALMLSCLTKTSSQSYTTVVQNVLQHFLPVWQPCCVSSIPNLTINGSRKYINFFTGSRDFSCSYTVGCARDGKPQAYGDIHPCQDQIYNFPRRLFSLTLTRLREYFC